MKKFIAAFVMMAMMGMCAGCGGDEAPKISSDRSMATGKEIITDEETGVQYIVIYHTSGVTVTPRYNADGSLRVKGGK